MSESSQETLERAIDAVKAGDKTKGKELLARVLREDRRNAQAWLWLTQTDITHEEKIKSLQNVLKYDPDNETAKAGLRQMRRSGNPGTVSKDPDQPTSSPNPRLSHEVEPTSKKWSNWIFVWTILGLFSLVCICSFLFAPLSNNTNITSTPTPGPTGPTPLQFNRFGAAVRCERFVTESLKSPSSAKFIEGTQEVFSVADKPANYHVVRGQVEAQNAFGVLLRAKYRCELHYVPGNSLEWVLDDIQIDEL